VHKIFILSLFLILAVRIVLAQCEAVPTVTTPGNIAAIDCQSNTISNNQTKQVSNLKTCFQIDAVACATANAQQQRD
jgi:hypothetical protein